MKNMSFSITTEQFVNGTKDVTRRWGWYDAKPGDRYCAVEKAMGLKKGEKMNRLGVIEVVSAQEEPLDALLEPAGASGVSYGAIEMCREGFPTTKAADFIAMLCKIRPATCKSDNPMRIEFRKIKP